MALAIGRNMRESEAAAGQDEEEEEEVVVTTMKRRRPPARHGMPTVAEPNVEKFISRCSPV